MLAGVTQGGSAPAAGAASLPAILERRARQEPERLAYAFLADGDAEESRLTYGELDRRARALARELLERGRAGDRALLLYPAGLDYVTAFFGCLYAGVIAVSTVPPRPNRPLTSLATVAKDCGARLALTTSDVLAGLASRWDEHPELAGVERLATDASDGAPVSFERRSPAPEDVAFLQYTSGSTSSPRGVVVTHANLVYNCGYMREAFGLSQDTISVTWLPHFHDMGLIDGLLNPVFTGSPVYVLPPVQFVRRPIVWLRAVSRYRATHSGAPNFAFDLCARKIQPEECAGLDLASWKTAYSGAEPVRAETLDRFVEAFAPWGFDARSLYPCYGLAEATLMVSGGGVSKPPVRVVLDAEALERHRVQRSDSEADDGAQTCEAVGCGQERLATRIRIVDPKTRKLAEQDRIGEIWVGGPTVARGYWGQPDATREVFEARIEGSDEGPFLRTGDLGFFLDDELFIAGRIKDLILIRGSNYYPQDIEWTAQNAHPALRPGLGIAFSIDVAGEERLVIVHEIERQHRSADEAELERIADAIQSAVAEQHELETYDVQLLRVGGVPVTSSGKLQRRSCRRDYQAGRLDALFESRSRRSAQAVNGKELAVPTREALIPRPPRERRRSIEAYLCGRLGALIGVAPRRIHPRAPLGSLGIDSLKGSQLVARLQEELGLELANTLVWNHPTIADVATHLAERMGLSLDPADRNGSRKGSTDASRGTVGGDGTRA